jgi:PEP-CTERM motif
MISTPTKVLRNGVTSREGKTIPMAKHLFRAAMIAGTALSLLTAAGPASADLVYDWTLSGTDTGSGTLTTGAPDGNGFDITAFTGTVDGNPIDGLLGLPLDPGGPTISPLGAFIYDNIVFPGSVPVFDTSGVLFSISGTEGNIWGNNGPIDYSYYECCYVISNDQIDTFTLTPAAVGEPSSIALFGSGLLGLWFVRRRKAV